jgi:hypothetical protein
VTKVGFNHKIMYKNSEHKLTFYIPISFLDYKDNTSNTQYAGLEICATGKWALQFLLGAHLQVSSYFMNFCR